MNFRVAHLQASALVFWKLDGDRVRAPVEVDVPAMRMALDALVMRDVQMPHVGSLSVAMTSSSDLG